MSIESALYAVPFEKVIEVENWLSIESVLSVFPFERVIQVQFCLSIESGLSAFDFEAGGNGSGGSLDNFICTICI